jgi:indolepyruvate ferredoxin oxidoreductase
MGPVLGLLARAKGLRGTWLDPFKWSVDRREDRAVLVEYEALLNRCLPHLRPGNLAQICDMARVPENIRGYGPVRLAAIQQARQRWQQLWQKCFGGSLGASVEGD